MSITVKNIEIERLAVSKVEIFANKKLPVKTVYWLSRLQKELNKLLKDYNEVKTGLFKKYCVKNDDGTPKIGLKGEFQFAGENTQSLLKEVSELANMEVEVLGINKIKLDLNDPGLQGSISAEDLIVLEPFIEIDTPEAL
jgi:hypothetical protein